MRSYYFINGIDTFPGDARNWNGRAVTWTHTRTGAKAEKIEYLGLPVTAHMFGAQRRRAEKLYRTMGFYGENWEHVVVGHSNGADVALEALRDFQCPPVVRLHLVCGATQADFGKNGLNDMLRHGSVEEVYVYVAGEDLALALASSWPARMLGYGCLGLHGPLGVASDVRDRVFTVSAGRWDGFGHSDCWNDMEFDETMRELTNA